MCVYIYVYTRPSQLSDGIRQQLAKYAWQLAVAMFTKDEMLNWGVPVIHQAIPRVSIPAHQPAMWPPQTRDQQAAQTSGQQRPDNQETYKVIHLYMIKYVYSIHI